MLPPSQKKPKNKISLTLHQQQTQSQTADLRKQQAQMDYMFDKQSTTSYSTNNNNNVQNFNRPSTNYQPNLPPYNPLKESQISVSNQSVASFSSRKANFRQFNQSMGKKNLATIPQGSTTGRARLIQPSNQANITKVQNYQTVPVSTNGMQNRTRPIQSFHETRMTNGSQHNLLNPQSQPIRYGAYEARKIQPNNSQQIPQRFEPISSRQANFTKNGSLYFDPLLASKQENDLLKDKIKKLQEMNIILEYQLKSQKDKNIYQSKRLQQESNEIKLLKLKVKQLQEKAQSTNGFFNRFIDRRSSDAQNKRVQNQLIQTKKKVSELQKTIQKINAQKETIKKQHQKNLRDKANQYATNINRITMDKENLFKILKSRDERIQQLQGQITYLQNNINQQQQLIKVIKQNWEKQAQNRFKTQINLLENRVNQLLQELQKGEQQKQKFAKQSLQRLEDFMKPKGK